MSLDPKVREAVNTLDKAVRNALESVYREGRARGLNILTGLADGDLSVNEFNDRSAAPKRRK